MPGSPAIDIGLDATLWDEPTTGIGLYTRELASALEQEGAHLSLFGAARSGQFPRGASSRTAFTLTRLPALLSRESTPLYHALGNFNLPLRKPKACRFILTVHDVIPELFPETVSRKFRWQFTLWLRRSLALADEVICVSQTTRDDLARLHPSLGSARVHVIHNGVDHAARSPPPSGVDADVLRGLSLPPRFVLFAGAWDVRKNIGLVLSAWERMGSGARVPLVLVGQKWFGADAASRRVDALRAAGHDIRTPGFVSSAVFYELMRRATVFVFPSLYEGFGLPPLEAMSLGTPVIVSRAGSLPEVCGDAAVQVSAHDPSALAVSLARLLASESERQSRREAGAKWSSAFTWKRAAAETRSVYEQALSRT